MKEELIEQWELYNDFLNKLVDEEKIGYTYLDSYKTFDSFMVWLATGRLSNGIR